MQLEDRLTYCKICTNQYFDKEVGILCQLTNEKPNFSPSCPDFNEDASERTEVENQLRYRISGMVDEDFKGKIVYTYTTTNSKIERTIPNLPEQVELKYSLSYTFLSILALPITLLIIFWKSGWQIPKPPIESIDMLILLLGLGFTIFGLYKAFNRTVEGTINENGFKLPNSTAIHWDKVLSIHFKRVTHNQGSETATGSQFLSLRTLGKNSETNIRLTPLNLSNSKLLTYLEAYRKKSKQKN